MGSKIEVIDGEIVCEYHGLKEREAGILGNFMRQMIITYDSSCELVALRVKEDFSGEFCRQFGFTSCMVEDVLTMQVNLVSIPFNIKGEVEDDIFMVEYKLPEGKKIYSRDLEKAEKGYQIEVNDKDLYICECKGDLTLQLVFSRDSGRYTSQENLVKLKEKLYLVLKGGGAVSVNKEIPRFITLNSRHGVLRDCRFEFKDGKLRIIAKVDGEPDTRILSNLVQGVASRFAFNHRWITTKWLN